MPVDGEAPAVAAAKAAAADEILARRLEGRDDVTTTPALVEGEIGDRGERGELRGEGECGISIVSLGELDIPLRFSSASFPILCKRQGEGGRLMPSRNAISLPSVLEPRRRLKSDFGGVGE